MSRINTSTLPKVKVAIFKAIKHNLLFRTTNIMLRVGTGITHRSLDYDHLYFFIKNNNLIQAIKYYREITYCGLAEAKSFILLLAGSYD